jgi:hypothetical protein
MRPNALRIIFGLLLGVLAAFFIGDWLSLRRRRRPWRRYQYLPSGFSPALQGFIR